MKTISELGLSRWQRAFLVAALLLIVFCVWIFNTALKWMLDKNDQISITIGAVALVVSAYSAMKTNRLKQFEVEKGYNAAKALIEVDAVEALKESSTAYEDLMSIRDASIEKWNRIVNGLKVLEKRYERRQDQLPFLASHLPPDKFIKIQAFYLELQRYFESLEDLKIPSNVGQADVGALIESRKKSLQSTYVQDQKSVLGKYQALEFAAVPKDIENRLTMRSK